MGLAYSMCPASGNCMRGLKSFVRLAKAEITEVHPACYVPRSYFSPRLQLCSFELTSTHLNRHGYSEPLDSTSTTLSIWTLSRCCTLKGILRRRWIG